MRRPLAGNGAQKQSFTRPGLAPERRRNSDATDLPDKLRATDLKTERAELNMTKLKARLRRLGKSNTRSAPPLTMQSSRFAGSDIRADILAKYGYDGDLSRLFAENQGPMVHKWHHYIPIYDRYFAAWRGKPLRFLEIGVSQGGSLQLWRHYFGPQATIFGIDINPACAQYDGQAGSVRIGSQADPAFLQRVVAEMGGIDIVLDDGSHRMDHVRASLEALFPHLATGGLYLIEDLHTAYWPGYGGGYRNRRNFFNVLRQIMDDMHRWYHDRADRLPALGGAVSAIHVHDSIVVIEKNPVFAPVHSEVS